MCVSRALPIYTKAIKVLVGAGSSSVTRNYIKLGIFAFIFVHGNLFTYRAQEHAWFLFVIDYSAPSHCCLKERVAVKLPSTRLPPPDWAFSPTFSKVTLTTPNTPAADTANVVARDDLFGERRVLSYDCPSLMFLCDCFPYIFKDFMYWIIIWRKSFELTVR